MVFFGPDWVARFIPPLVQSWLVASALAVAIGLTAMTERHLATEIKDDPLNDFLFTYIAMPLVLLFVATIGDTRVRRTKRHRPQNWASLFLGILAIAFFEGQVLLPGLWPLALVVPTTAIFWVFYRVKHDAPGAVDAFWANRGLVAIRTFVWAVRDRLEGPEWRDRLEERYAAYEAELLGFPGPLMQDLRRKQKLSDEARRRMEAEVNAGLGLAPAPSKKRKKARRQGGGNRHEPS